MYNTEMANVVKNAVTTPVALELGTSKSIVGDERKASDRVAERPVVLMEKIMGREYSFWLEMFLE